jgi:hypothetical protein
MVLEVIRRSQSQIWHGQRDSEKEKMGGYIVACFCMMLVVIMIFRNRGFKTCAAVVIYLAALSTMSLVLKNIFVEQRFDFPLWITSVHFLCTSAAAFGILYRRALIMEQPITRLQVRTLLRGVGPVAVCFSMSVGLCNKGLSFSNAHFYEMVDTATPLVTAILTILMGKAFQMQLMWPLGVVTFALVCCWSGEAQFSPIAFVCLLSGTILRAFKGVLNQILMSASVTSPSQVLDPVELVMYTSVTSFFIMGSWSLASDGLLPFYHAYADGRYSGVFAISLSIANAMVINFAGIFVIRDLGAVAQQLTGCLKGVLTVTGGVAVRGEILSVQQAVGYIVLVCGIAWYNDLDKKLKDCKQAT